MSSAVYEWNYPRQMVEICLSEWAGDRDCETLAADIFTERFPIERPLLKALEPEIEGPPVFLIDELDRTDEPFEAFLLEVLSDYRITVPELGTTKVSEAPAQLSAQVVAFVQGLRQADLFKLPDVAETIDWAKALTQLDTVALHPQAIDDTLGVLLK